MSTTNTRIPEQAAAIAVRRNGQALEVCLIRQKESEHWGIPKGIVDPGDTHEQTALNEAWEEAGLKGRLLGDVIGTYEYEKWYTTFVVAVYVMEVLEQHDEWQEAVIRERKWTSFGEAASLLMDHPVQPLLDRARRTVAKGSPDKVMEPTQNPRGPIAKPLGGLRHLLLQGGGMRKLVYSTSLSLDGYIDSAAGDSSWVVPDEELHKHFNDVERETDTLLYGRRMYEIMAGFWPTADQDPSAPGVIVEYAQIWKPIPKVVFSSTLESVDWNSRLIRGDAVAEVARLKAQPGGSIGVGGLGLASALASAGLIDEYRLYYVPIFLGSGKAAFSQIQTSVRLKPVETHTFSSGTVLLRCASVTP